jgi:hypothetical protein
MAGLVDDNQKHTLEEVLQQFVSSQLRGQEQDVEELVKHYPEYEHQIRKRLQKLHKINNLFDSLVQTDDSDFEDVVTEPDLVGRKIGSFEITEMIGRGGMGIVYLAHDTKLKRPVAIKSIPAALADNSTARMRFRREAELLEEVLSIGQQVAEAILTAHKKGIVHRDLKPGNIKITPDGRVKVLDFGLAKVSTSEGKDGETTATHPGRVIGTPAYMSPEQARGKATDHRTDIWSFGCVMYQMLTSHLPFEGETATDTLARIIERQPDWELLPQNTPVNIRTLIQRCLEKEPDRRLGDIADAAIEISETLTKPQTAPTAKLRRIAMIVGASIIIVIIAIVLRLLPEKQAQSSLKQIRLVVLPFENVGPAEEEY